MLVLILCYIIFVNPNFSTGLINDGSLKNFYPKDRCQNLGDKCQQTTDCCSHLTCYLTQNQNLCLPSNKQMKRYVEDSVVPPYYNPKNYLYQYGINMPPFPFYNAYREKQTKPYIRNKMEWDHCQFHEDCGEGNCCYAHFRFRSLPKSFCRPNRNNIEELCEPLARYRSLKDIPAWKQRQLQRQKAQDKQQQPEQQPPQQQQQQQQQQANDNPSEALPLENINLNE